MILPADCDDMFEVWVTLDRRHACIETGYLVRLRGYDVIGCVLPFVHE